MFIRVLRGYPRRPPTAVTGGRVGFHRRLSAFLHSKLDKGMLHDESRKPVYFGVKRSKVKVTRHKKNIAGAGFYTLVSADFF